MKDIKTMKASRVRETWREAIDTVAWARGRIRIERGGMPVAALVSWEDLEWLRLRDLRLDQLRTTVAAMRDLFADVAPQEMEAEVTRAVETTRAERLASQKGRSLPKPSA